jgi:GNAT superfamily N-acetyltransferase
MSYKLRPGHEKDVRSIAQTHVASWRQAYKGILSPAFLENLSVEERAKGWQEAITRFFSRDPQKLIVVEDAQGAIVGFAAAGVNRENDPEFDAEIYALYLLEEHQGQGLGTKMMREMMGWLRSKGFQKVMLWVLEANPTRKFYEKRGGKLLASIKTTEIGGENYNEVAYGWDLS